MSCEYCAKEYKSLDNFTHTAIVYIQDGRLWLETVFDQESIKIEYCPMCGRKLGE